MEIDPIHVLYDNLVADITPIAFEELCFEVVKGYAEKEKLSDFQITHNKKIPVNDGTYQIDVYAEFTALGVKHKTIIECKRQSHPIKREVVVVLAGKVRSLGAQKGILISTCGFQKGAIQYAKQYGIALLQIINEQVMHIQNSTQMPNVEQQKIMLEYRKRLPQHCVMEWDLEFDYPSIEAYPTEAMKNRAKEEVKMLFFK
ncbi:MAG: restriction endonuclease [Tissierellia bacterium]|nr:restriction endonuclease [Tissierellia bacterium]